MQYRSPIVGTKHWPYKTCNKKTHPFWTRELTNHVKLTIQNSTKSLFATHALTMQHLQSRIRPIETIEALQNRIARTILFKSVHLPYKLARQDILFKTLLSPYSSADLRNIQELVSELSKQTGRICLHTTNMAVYQRKNNCWQPELFDFLKMIVVLLFGVCIVPVWAPRKKFVLSIPSIVGQFPPLSGLGPQQQPLHLLPWSNLASRIGRWACCRKVAEPAQVTQVHAPCIELGRYPTKCGTRAPSKTLVVKDIGKPTGEGILSLSFPELRVGSWKFHGWKQNIQ